MLNVSGHLMSTAQVESVLAEHNSVAEAAVVSKAHPVKGQCLYCFITPNEGMQFNKKLQDELKKKGTTEFCIYFHLNLQMEFKKALSLFKLILFCIMIFLFLLSYSKL